jgi:dihydroorotase
MIKDMRDKDKSYKSEASVLIKGGMLIDTANDSIARSDILIEQGIISRIADKIDISRDDILKIDASGLHISPTFFDMHVHLREPGSEESEDISSGIKAALRGGVGSLACMPNTSPAIDSTFMVESIRSKARSLSYDVYPVAAMTKNIEGRDITEIGILKQSGAVGLSDDGRCVQDARTMLEIMRYAKEFDIRLIIHAEDQSLSHEGCINEGPYSTLLGLNAIPKSSEEIIVQRDIYLAKKSKAKIHFTHVSSRGSLEMIKRAKEEGIDLTCDVTPNHFFFDESFLGSYDTNFKINPPIGSKDDQEHIIKAIKDGIIDAIASDHAPHTFFEKSKPIELAPFGAIGLETLFKASYTKLVKENNIDIIKIIKMLTSSPLSILGIDIPKVKEGIAPDMCLLDLGKSRRYLIEDIISKSKNSPFIGHVLWGEIAYTFSKGRLVFENKK